MATLDKPTILKGLVDTYSTDSVNQASLQKDFDHFIEKGKGAQIWEIRTWGGEQYVKHTDGWVHVHKKTGKVSVLPTSGTVRKLDGNDEHRSHYNNHAVAKTAIDSKEQAQKIKDDAASVHLYKDEPKTINLPHSNDLPLSLRGLVGKDLKVKESKTVNFASGPQTYHVVEHDSEEHEIPERFLKTEKPVGFKPFTKEDFDRFHQLQALAIYHALTKQKDIKEYKELKKRYEDYKSRQDQKASSNLSKLTPGSDNVKNLDVASEFPVGSRVTTVDSFGAGNSVSGTVNGYTHHEDKKNGYVHILGDDGKQHKMVWSAVKKEEAQKKLN